MFLPPLSLLLSLGLPVYKMGTGPQIFSLAYKIHHHRTRNPNRGDPVQLLKAPSLLVQLLLLSCPPPVFATFISELPLPTSPFILPLPSLP